MKVKIPCMPLVYIAGPFRGPALSTSHPISRNSWIMECNCRRAEALALEVWGMGASVICPHANTRYFQNSLPDETWLNGDLVQVARCDALVLTIDWFISEGAKHEREVAHELGIPIFYDGHLVQLKTWIEQWKKDDNYLVLDRRSARAEHEYGACLKRQAEAVAKLKRKIRRKR